ncbi:MAG: hypothetical protein JKY81_05595 [Colwellia sp.]|nr:hypothetical protein [Colwellia sp.]
MAKLTLDIRVTDTKPIADLLTMLDDDSDCIEEPLRTKLIVWAELNNKVDDNG